MWYRAFFGEEYWEMLEAARALDALADEAAEIERQIRKSSPGLRVCDFGCGVGHHAIGLALAGFEVIGLEASAWAISEARRRGVRRHVLARWEQCNVLTAFQWPVAEIDAALCVGLLGRASDAQDRKMLRQVRRHLAENGLLVVRQLTGTRWVRQIERWARNSSHGEKCYGVQHAIQPGVGRAKGELIVSSFGEPDHALPWNMRLYAMNELIDLVRSAGFLVERVEDGAEDESSIEHTQIIARALPAAPRALAPIGWRTPAAPLFEMRYASDETPFLNPPPEEIWRSMFNEQPASVIDAASCYPVDDPYGAERAAPIVSRYFNCSLPPDVLTFAPGVTSLLRSLSGLTHGGSVVSITPSHPDIQAWALGDGAGVHLVKGPSSADDLLQAAQEFSVALIALDRPSIQGELMSGAQVEMLARGAAQQGAIVLIDESAASCLGPGASAVAVTQKVDNLIVLRGMTKAYSCGGLRIALAVASPAIASQVRELVPPIQVNELAFRMAMRLLEQGDIFSGLRRRIRLAKSAMTGLLRGAGFDVIKGHPEVQWVLARDPHEPALDRLARMGIRALRLSPSPLYWGESMEFVQLSVPLSAQRLVEFTRLLTIARGCDKVKQTSISYKSDTILHTLA